MKHEEYLNRYIILKDIIIKDIFSLLKIANANNISINTGIIYNYIDDQFNEVIKEIDCDTRDVIIDGNTYDYRVSIYYLEIDKLIAILEAIETNDYEIFD